MPEELFRLTQAESGILSQDAYPDLSPTYPNFIDLYRYQVPVDKRLIFKPGHTFSIYAMLLSDQALDGAVALDAESATVETVDANDAGTNDMNITPDTPAVSDEYHFGYRFPFRGVTVKYITAATDGTQVTVWEYSTAAGTTPDNATWAALRGVTDGTGYWLETGSGGAGLDVTWTTPRDWVQTTVPLGGSRLFWVRSRVTTAAGSSNACKGDQAWINPDPTVADNSDLFRIEVRDQNELVRKPILQNSMYLQCNEFEDRDKINRLTIAEPVVAGPGSWVVISAKVLGVVDVSGCYFVLTCDREAVHLF